jgi:hypothetical protein
MAEPQEEPNNAEKINQLLVLALRLPNEDFKTLVDSLVSRLPNDNFKPANTNRKIQFAELRATQMVKENMFGEEDSKYISGCDPYVTYSESEVIELLQKYRLALSEGKTPNLGDTTKYWFEQNKKK